MTDINNVNLVGRLTRDADLRFTNSGSPVSKFSIAVNRSKKVGDNWEEEVNYFDVALWGKIAEALGKYLTKGKQVAVTGELRQSRWEKDGQKRSKVEVHANNIQLLGGGQESSSNPQSGKSQQQNGQSYNNNQQQQNNGYQGQQNNYAKPQQQQQHPPYQGNSDQFDNDGIPF